MLMKGTRKDPDGSSKEVCGEIKIADCDLMCNRLLSQGWDLICVISRNCLIMGRYVIILPVENEDRGDG